jgi:FkbM family methyltransferase
MVVVGRVGYRALRALPPPLVARIQSVVARRRTARRLARWLTQPLRAGAYPIARGPAAGMLMDLAGSRPSYLLGATEPELVALLQRHLRPGDVVLDLGANVGFFTLIGAALVGDAGRVVAVEPLPRNAYYLRRNVALNHLANVTVVQAAVSEGEGVLPLSLGESDQDGTLTGSGGPALAVRTVSVDALVEELGVRPALVKIDVEGAEACVLEGMAATLRTARPIVVCEVHTHGPSLEHPVAVALAGAGYRLSWLEDEATAGPPMWAPHLVAMPAA